MRRHGLIHGRRGAALGASVAVLCLGGGVLAACGGESGDDDGYAAVGAAGSSPDRAPGRAVPPDGEVELVPLVPLVPFDGKARSGGGEHPEHPEHPAKGGGSPADGTGESTGEGASGAAGGDSSGSGKPAGQGGSGPAPGRTGSGGSGTPGSPADPGSPGAGSPGTDPGSPGTGPGSPPTTEPPPPPPTPAALKMGEPVRAGADKRWCEKVTVRFRNTGGSAVRSGSVTFATHIIGALGVDWGTRYSTQPLPGPIAGGGAANRTYTVCVDSWRVPLGMRVETQDVTADWK